MNATNKSPIRSINSNSFQYNPHSNNNSSTTKQFYNHFQSKFANFSSIKTKEINQDILNKIIKLQLALCQAIQRNQQVLFQNIQLQQQKQNYESLLFVAGQQNYSLQRKVQQLIEKLKRFENKEKVERVNKIKRQYSL